MRTQSLLSRKCNSSTLRLKSLSFVRSFLFSAYFSDVVNCLKCKFNHVSELFCRQPGSVFPIRLELILRTFLRGGQLMKGEICKDEDPCGGFSMFSVILLYIKKSLICQINCFGRTRSDVQDSGTDIVAQGEKRHKSLPGRRDFI